MVTADSAKRNVTVQSALMWWSNYSLICRIILVPDFDIAASFQQIEAEVLKVFNRSDIVTPDEVRGNYSTLAEAELADSRYTLFLVELSWPTVLLSFCCSCCMFYATWVA